MKRKRVRKEIDLYSLCPFHFCVAQKSNIKWPFFIIWISAFGDIRFFCGSVGSY